MAKEIIKAIFAGILPAIICIGIMAGFTIFALGVKALISNIAIQGVILIPLFFVVLGLMAKLVNKVVDGDM